MTTRTWYEQGYADAILSYRRTLENPTDHHPDYVRGWRDANGKDNVGAMVHMTTTTQEPGDKSGGERWRVQCRCQWASIGHTSQAHAREAGDKHLAEANQTSHAK